VELEILKKLQSLRNPTLDRIWIMITSLANGGWFYILLGVVLSFLKKTRKIGVHVLLALMFSVVFCNLILKTLVARDRPSWLVPDVDLPIKNPKDFSFPSGHTSAAVAAATAVFMHNKKHGKFLYILAECIAFSRMYLFVHFPTDIFGGAVTGVASAIPAYFTVQWFGNRHKKKNAQ